MWISNYLGKAAQGTFIHVLPSIWGTIVYTIIVLRFAPEEILKQQSKSLGFAWVVNPGFSEGYKSRDLHIIPIFRSTLMTTHVVRMPGGACKSTISTRGHQTQCLKYKLVWVHDKRYNNQWLFNISAIICQKSALCVVHCLRIERWRFTFSGTHIFFNGAHPGLCGLKQTFRRSPVRSNNRFSVGRSLVRYRQSSLTIMMDVIEAVQTVSV